MGGSRIILEVSNGSYRFLKRTIRIRGAFRYQLAAAAKVLSLISSTAEEHQGLHLEARVRLVNLEKAELFENLVKSFSPVPVRIEYVREEVVR